MINLIRKSPPMLTGSLVAIATPMFENGDLDFASLKKLVDWHIGQGTDGIVAVGTTGESPTVDVAEHIEIIRVIIEQAAGRVPVIVTTSHYGTQVCAARSLREALQKQSFALHYQPQLDTAINASTPDSTHRSCFRTSCDAATSATIQKTKPPASSAQLPGIQMLRHSQAATSQLRLSTAKISMTESAVVPFASAHSALPTASTSSAEPL